KNAPVKRHRTAYVFSHAEPGVRCWLRVAGESRFPDFSRNRQPTTDNQDETKPKLYGLTLPRCQANPSHAQWIARPTARTARGALSLPQPRGFTDEASIASHAGGGCPDRRAGRCWRRRRASADGGQEQG